MGLGRRKDEEDAFRRFFQRFEQSVEGLRRQHMHFVDDVDFIMSRRRRKLHGFAQIADLVDAAVGCRVNLEHIHRRTVADAAAGVTDTAWRERRALGAVQRACENLCRACLPCTARARKEVGVARLPRRHRTCKRAADVLLPHEIRERLRTPTAIECNIGHENPPNEKSSPTGLH